MGLLQCTIIFLCVAISNAKWVREMENPALFQGDMKLRPDQLEALNKKHSAFASIIGYRWPNGIVPYYIDGSIGRSGADAVRAAIDDYHQFTCLKFVARKREREYLYFTDGTGCSSPVGWNNPRYTRNGVNKVELAGGCRYKGTVMHEIGHSIGLYHEQSRPDRDNYVQVLKHNVYDQTLAYNFDKYNTGTINSLGFAYDYESMMHYDRTAFGCNKYGRNCKDTIRTLDASKQNVIGQRNGFSQGDIDQINKMYNCKTGGGGTKCVDKDTNCAYWAGIGECKSNLQWMAENCKKSCTQVNGDKDKNCAAWAKSGECKTNPNWMLVNCKKSCDVC